jgi:hypothetical protein
MPCLRVKNGVQFTTIAPAGFRMLGELERLSRSLGFDLTITSACDGEHSGLNDPHHKGMAYDVRTKTLSNAQKSDLLQGLLTVLRDADDQIVPVSIGYATRLFYAQLEDVGGENEHLHVQQRNGRSYPVTPSDGSSRA